MATRYHSSQTQIVVLSQMGLICHDNNELSVLTIYGWAFGNAVRGHKVPAPITPRVSSIRFRVPASRLQYYRTLSLGCGLTPRS